MPAQNCVKSATTRALLRLVGRAALAAALWAGASAARAQPGGPPVDPNDPAAVEQMNAAMQDAFEDAPFSVNPEGMTAGEGMFGAFFGPSVTKGDFVSFVKILGLAKDQAEAATAIYRQRLENYEVKGKPMQEMITELMKKMMQSMGRGDQFEPDNMEQLTKAAVEIQVERATMTKGVLEDLKALLTPEQEPRWPKVEMAERRNRLMRFQPMQMAPGVQLDLRKVLDTALAKPGVAKPDAGVMERIDQVLGTYEIAVDEQAKIAVPLDDTFRSQMANTKPTPEQQERSMKAMGEGMVIGSKVRDATETAAKGIAAALSGALPATKDAFMNEYYAAGFPSVYRQSHAERVVEAALKFDDLTEEQLKSLTAIKSEIDTKFKDLRPKAMEEAVEMFKIQGEMMAAKDEAARQKVIEKMTGRMSMNAKFTMKEADKDVVKRVRALMTEAQRDRLPKRPRMNLPFEVQPAAEATDK